MAHFKSVKEALHRASDGPLNAELGKAQGQAVTLLHKQISAESEEVDVAARPAHSVSATGHRPSSAGEG